MLSLERALYGQILCVIAILLVDNYECNAQLVSPCPKLFKYDTKGPEKDRWYGTLTVLSDADLAGVYVTIILDKPAIQLGNWFGIVLTDDNIEYVIKNKKHKLPANVPLRLRFYIKYNSKEPPPKLVKFLLNARTVCSDAELTTEATETGPLITSEVLSSTSLPLSALYARGSFNHPGESFDDEEEEDYFHGDIHNALFGTNKTHNNGPDMDYTCGSVVMAPQPLISNGLVTNEGEFPWHVAIYHAQGVGLLYICGGSLISKNHVLTAAHCVTKISRRMFDPDTLMLYTGKYYFRKLTSVGIQYHHVEKIFRHPNYDGQTFKHDIAILQLKSPVQITPYVRPICLWDSSTTLETVINKRGTVIGWGYDETGHVSARLNKAQMPIVSHNKCIQSNPNFFSRFVSDTTYCAGFRNGTTVCNGDSGGGMVFPKSGNSPESPIWQLRGLISISTALQKGSKCDLKSYVVFTDVAKYLDWIQASITEQ